MQKVRCAPARTPSGSVLAIGRMRRMVPLPFFDWPTNQSFLNSSFLLLTFSLGGVPDSTLGWSAPLPVESDGLS